LTPVSEASRQQYFEWLLDRLAVGTFEDHPLYAELHHMLPALAAGIYRREVGRDDCHRLELALSRGDRGPDRYGLGAKRGSICGILNVGPLISGSALCHDHRSYPEIGVWGIGTGSRFAGFVQELTFFGHECNLTPQKRFHERFRFERHQVIHPLTDTD